MYQYKIMSKRVYSFIVLLILIIYSSSMFAGCYEEPQQAVLASVNNEIIKKEDVEEILNLIYLYMPDTCETNYRNDNTDGLREEALWLLIENALISQEVRELGLPANEDEIERHYQLAREELISGIYGSEEQFLDRLRELGLNEHSLKSVSRNAYLNELLYEYVSADVTEEDAAVFVKENPLFLRRPARAYVLQILLENRDDASHVYNLLIKGADFVEVGERYSVGPFLELGLINANDMLDPLFLETAFSLEPGEISEPVEISGKYHIIKITAKDEAADLSFEEVKEEAMEIKKLEYFEHYYLTLVEDAVIETFKLDE